MVCDIAVVFPSDFGSHVCAPLDSRRSSVGCLRLVAAEESSTRVLFKTKPPLACQVGWEVSGDFVSGSEDDCMDMLPADFSRLLQGWKNINVRRGRGG